MVNTGTAQFIQKIWFSELLLILLYFEATFNDLKLLFALNNFDYRHQFGLLMDTFQWHQMFCIGFHK